MKIKSYSTAARVLLVTPFLMASVCLFVLAFSNLSASNRPQLPSAKPSPNVAVPVPFSGTYDPTVFPCATPKHAFASVPNQVRIIVQVSATLPTNDLTVTLLYGQTPATAVVVAGPEDTGVSSELLLYQPAGGVPSTFN